MGDLDQFKFGEQRLLIATGKHDAIYDGYKIQVGLETCECTSDKLSIRDSFKCEACRRYHSHSCSKQEVEDIIANDYFMQGENFCKSCSQ